MLILFSLIIVGCRGNSADEGLEVNGDTPVAEEVDAPEAISSGTVTASLLNIHETPGTDAPIVYQAPAGTEVDIFAETALGDSVWYQVRARSETLPSELGWAFSRYIDTGENSGQNSSAGNQPSTPPSSGGSGTSSGGSGGIDPEAPGGNPDTSGGVGGYPGEADGGVGGYPGEADGGVGGYPGEDNSRPSLNDSRPSLNEEN